MLYMTTTREIETGTITMGNGTTRRAQRSTTPAGHTVVMYMAKGYDEESGRMTKGATPAQAETFTPDAAPAAEAPAAPAAGAPGPLWINDSGEIACILHGGSYLAFAVQARPRARLHSTPLGTWQRLSHDDLADLGAQFAAVGLPAPACGTC